MVSVSVLTETAKQTRPSLERDQSNRSANQAQRDLGLDFRDKQRSRADGFCRKHDGAVADD
jgi:hypothetical protein